MRPDSVDSFDGAYTPRALRYTVLCPVSFRQGRSDAWRNGRLKNISVTGLLFEPDVPLSTRSSLEITFALPPPVVASLSCRAEVVRHDPATGAVAARIVEYSLGRLSPGRAVPTETQDVLWTMSRDGSCADAIVVRTEEGAELQYRMDDNCYYTHRYEEGEQQQMLEDALAMRRHLEARGWVAETIEIGAK